MTGKTTVLLKVLYFLFILEHEILFVILYDRKDYC